MSSGLWSRRGRTAVCQQRVKNRERLWIGAAGVRSYSLPPSKVPVNRIQGPTALVGVTAVRVLLCSESNTRVGESIYQADDADTVRQFLPAARWRAPFLPKIQRRSFTQGDQG